VRSFRTVSPSLCRPSIAPFMLRGQVKDAGGSFADRESSLEEKALRQHDQDVLRRLRESLKLQENQRLPDLQVAKDEKGSPVVVNKPTSSSAADSITTDDFLEFRKQILEKVRDLEDEVDEIKIRLKRIKKE